MCVNGIGLCENNEFSEWAFECQQRMEIRKMLIHLMEQLNRPTAVLNQSMFIDAHRCMKARMQSWFLHFFFIFFYSFSKKKKQTKSKNWDPFYSEWAINVNGFRVFRSSTSRQWNIKSHRNDHALDLFGGIDSKLWVRFESRKLLNDQWVAMSEPR